MIHGIRHYTSSESAGIDRCVSASIIARLGSKSLTACFGFGSAPTPITTDSSAELLKRLHHLGLTHHVLALLADPFRNLVRIALGEFGQK